MAAVLVLGAAVVITRPPAGAADLDELRARAQAIADEVTSLEQHLTQLDQKKAFLATQIEDANADIGTLELEIHNVDAQLDVAQDRYVARAVEAYKSGSTGAELEMMLSTKDLGQMLTLAQANANSAEADQESLEELLAAKQEAEDAQERIDVRKQELLATQSRLDTVGEAISSTIDERHTVLHELNGEIAELERLARIEARRLAAQAAAQSSAQSTKLTSGGGPAAGIPDGYASTGVSFEGTASWYGPGFEGNPTASGQIFDSSLFTAASRDLPLGTWLYVTHEGRGVVVLVNDRGPYVGDRVLDLSRAAAESLGISGLGWVRAEIVVKT
jgi:rare lipoprotein A (peptidoglycan hydrolase)